MGIVLLCRMADQFSGFLEFNKKERQAVIFLVTAILIIRMTIFFSDPLRPSRDEFPEEIAGSTFWMVEWYDSLAEIKKTQDLKRSSGQLLSIRLNPDSLFTFDPNSLPAEGWKKMGLPEKTISSIINYRDKGGRFRKPEDIRKIFNMPPEAAEALMPFVRINSSSSNLMNAADKSRSIKKVDINAADSAGWASLPGIGPVLAARTVAYRNRLGGFFRKDQIREVYGLTDSLYTNLEPLLSDGTCCAKYIMINQAGQEEMARHPYIGKKKAMVITRYRDQHGHFESPDDLLKILDITPEFLEKLRPYLNMGRDKKSLNQF